MFEAEIHRIYPKCVAEVWEYPDKRELTIELLDSYTFSFADLEKLAAVLGTKNINLGWAQGWGGTDVTPGYSAEFRIYAKNVVFDHETITPPPEPTTYVIWNCPACGLLCRSPSNHRGGLSEISCGCGFEVKVDGDRTLLSPKAVEVIGRNEPWLKVAEGSTTTNAKIEMRHTNERGPDEGCQ